MITDFLQNQAALYASGAMTAEERDQLELILEFHSELREFVSGLEEIGAAVTLATQPPAGTLLSLGFKARLTGLIASRPQHLSAGAQRRSPASEASASTPIVTCAG